MEMNDSFKKVTMSKWWKLLATVVTCLVIVLVYYIGKRAFFLEFVENYELAYQYNWRTGEVTMLDRPGYHRVQPLLTSIYTIDLRPMQVCVEANDRVLNCKLVEFNKAGFEEFIAMHGAANYEGQPFQEILKSYAYDGRSTTYPFLTVLRELGNDSMVSATP